MALNIINQPRTDAGSLFTSGFGQGISSGIQQLAQMKLQQIHQRENHKYQSDLNEKVLIGSGYSPEVASNLKHADPVSIQQLVKFGAKDLAPASQIASSKNGANNSGQAIATPGQPNVVPAQNQEPANNQPVSAAEKTNSQQQQAFNQAALLNASKDIGGDYLKNLFNPQQPGINAPQTGSPQAQSSPAVNQVAPQLPREVSNEPIKSLTKEERIAEHKAAKEEPEKTYGQKLADAKNQIAKAKQAEKDLKEQKKQQKIDIDQADKDTKKSWDAVKEQYETGKEVETNIRRIGKILDKGKITPYYLDNFISSLEEINPTYATAAGAAIGGHTAGALGAGAGAALGLFIKPVVSLVRSATQKIYPDTDEMKKLSKDFIRFAPAIFPRLTEKEAFAYMQTVVNESQTDAGKKRVMDKMLLPVEAIKIKYEAGREIIKENNGHRPSDFDEQIRDRTENRIDKIYKKFIEGIPLNS